MPGGGTARVARDRAKMLRDFDAGQFLDLFFVAAAVTVLVIRFVLAATDYPRLAVGGLHIAHLLWGGLLMLVALVLLLSFLDRTARRLAALIGGVGFGGFIDEVGKFITNDNDYFYRPSVAIIYVVFVLSYLAARSLHRERAARPAEYLANALEEVLELATGDLDRRERDRALDHLGHARGNDALTRALGRALTEADVRPERPGLPARWAAWLSARYRDLAVSPEFGRVLIIFFSIQLLLKLARVVTVVGLIPDMARTWQHLSFLGEGRGPEATAGLILGLQIGSILISALFVAIGIALIFRDRLRALRMFQRSILIALLLTQGFVFYRIEWLGLGELVLNLFIFFALRFMIDREKHWQGAHSINTSLPPCAPLVVSSR